MAAIFGEGKCSDFSKIDEIALSGKEIEGNLCFAIFGKNGRLGRGKFLEDAFLSYPVGRKFRRNRSISHG